MPAPQQPLTREEIARLGDWIYDNEIRHKVEPQEFGRFVAIDVDSHAYVVANDLLSASDSLQAQHPNAEIWLVRVGHRALHRIGGHIDPKCE